MKDIKKPVQHECYLGPLLALGHHELVLYKYVLINTLTNKPRQYQRQSNLHRAKWGGEGGKSEMSVQMKSPKKQFAEEISRFTLFHRTTHISSQRATKLHAKLSIKNNQVIIHTGGYM